MAKGSMGSVVAASAVFLAVGSAVAQDNQALINSALSAAPPMIANTATVMTMSGQVLRPGAGEYTCFPREHPGETPMCLDAEWLRWADAWLNKKDFMPSRNAIAYMLAGDLPDAGASNKDPFAKAPTPDNDWIVEGPHIMLLVPDPAVLNSVSADYRTGAPYVMWQGTPYAHVMVTVGPRPPQRTR